MGFFKVKAKNKLEELEIGSRIEESDFSCITNNGVFVQLAYTEEDEDVTPYEVKPGIWSIQKTPSGLHLLSTSFVNDKILESFLHTSHITEKIDCFFRKLHVYAEHGIEIPKRAMLFYGAPGNGKTTILNKVCSQYVKDGKTAVVIWTTDKYEAYQIKDFIKSFSYKEVEKLILIVEDIGGVEIDQVRARSDSSLLSLLDNQEKTFKIPVLILATTNHPEIFLGNLTNRPGRFDDKIEVGYPPANFRSALLKFFAKVDITDSDLTLIESNACSKFSPAHIREVVLRSAIYEKSIEIVIKEMLEEIQNYEKAFSKQKKLGIHD